MTAFRRAGKSAFMIVTDPPPWKAGKTVTIMDLAIWARHLTRISCAGMEKLMITTEVPAFSLVLPSRS
jgi:hypothetical protein